MKAGDEITCEFCGANSFLVKKAIMDGWIKTGEALLCSSCSNVIHKITEDEKLPDNEKDEDREKKILDDFSGFLGAEDLKRPAIIFEEDEKHFCRDCKHYAPHPFLDRCSLHLMKVNPMDDCKSFKNNEQ